jgi:hypothetical protein
VRYGVYLLRVKAPGYGTGEKEVNVSEPVVNIGTIRLSTMPMQVIDVNPSPGTLNRYIVCRRLPVHVV